MIHPHADNVVPGRVTLRTLTSMRWLVVAGQLVAVLVVYFGFGFDLMLWPCLALIAASIAVNVHATLRPQGRTLSERSTAAYLAYDTLQLAGLLYLTGGIENPFAVLLLGPMTVAAGVLGRAHVTALALLGMLCLGVLTIGHFELPWAGTDPMPDFPPLYRNRRLGALWLAAGFIAILQFFGRRRGPADFRRAGRNPDGAGPRAADLVAGRPGCRRGPRAGHPRWPRSRSSPRSCARSWPPTVR